MLESQQKLPIIATFMQVLIVMKERYIYFIKFSIPIFVFVGLAYIFQSSLMPSSIPNSPEPSRLLFFIFWLLGFFTITMVIVAYHRTFIMNIEDVEKTGIFRLGSREWRFIGWYFAMSFFIGIIVAVVMYASIGFLKEGNVQTARIITFAIMIPIFYLSAHWLLVLPASSVDDSEASLSYAWDISQGNGWRIAVLVFGIPSAVNTLNLYVFSYNYMILTILGVIISLFAMVLGIGVISLSYSYLKLNSKQTPTIEA